VEQRKQVILCVDDELNPLILRRFVLEKCGYEVITATSGAEAMRVLAEDQPIDLVLTDLLMPVMTGAELARQVKARHPGIPVVLISGVNEFSEDIKAANLFISKLEGPEAMSRKISEVLKAHPSQPVPERKSTAI